MASHPWYEESLWKRKLQPQIIRRDPICADPMKIGCMRPSTQVDHIIPFGNDRVLFTSYDNLQGVCASCHALKTARDQNRSKGQTKNAVPEGSWSSSAYGTPTAIKS